MFYFFVATNIVYTTTLRKFFFAFLKIVEKMMRVLLFVRLVVALQPGENGLSLWQHFVQCQPINEAE